MQPPEGHAPLSLKDLAQKLPDEAYQKLSWREGTNEPLSYRFAILRIRPARRAAERGELAPEEWLVIEWPEHQHEPEKYFLSSLPEQTPAQELVRLAKLRWRIERDYQELKQELGIGHFQGRNWRGFHHHATLCIDAYGYLVSQRLQPSKKNFMEALPGPEFALSEGYKPRGTPPASEAPA